MPTYEVTGPNGRKFELTGDSPPTEGELEIVFAAMEKKGQKIPWANTSQYDLPSPLTVAAHVATGINKGVSNLAGLPVDTVNRLLGIVGLESKEPIMGSENIQKRLMPTPLQPQGVVQNVAQATGEQIPGAAAAMLTGGGSMGAQALGNTARVVVGSGVGSGLARTVLPDSPVADIAGGVAGGVAGGLATKLPKGMQEVQQLVNKIIDYGWNKGVKPIGGPRTVDAPTRYTQSARTAVTDIVQNKGSITLTDMEGKAVKNDVPHTFPQMLQAIGQRLTANFKAYFDEVRAVTGKDVQIPLNKVTASLEKFIADKVNQTEAPEAVAYAMQRLEAYRNAGTYTPEQMERALQSYTQLVGKLVRHVGNKQSLGQDAVDAITQKAMRETMDDIMARTGEGIYRPAKDTYAALKQVEADVVNRAKVTQRQGEYSLIDFSDVYLLPELAISMATGSFGRAAMAAGGKLMARHIKQANNPVTVIKNMFDQVDKLAPSLPGPKSKWMPESTGDLFTPKYESPQGVPVGSPYPGYVPASRPPVPVGEQGLVPTGVKKDIFPVREATPMPSDATMLRRHPMGERTLVPTGLGSSYPLPATWEGSTPAATRPPSLTNAEIEAARQMLLDLAKKRR